MKVDYREACLLYAKLPAFARKVKRANAVTQEAIELQDIRWYVAFSGGKDSEVVLDMVSSALPNITAMWGDDGWDYPETLVFIGETEARYGIRIMRIKNRGNIAGFAAWAGCDDWRGANPGPWDHECASFDDHSRLIRELGFGGVFLGLRKQESTRRLFALRRSGPLYWTKRERIWHCC
ncbi:MAG: phosphoadenosine phosphosulfate reductase family protein, partial [Alphaproteobacteria bacterium]|nr:phosphoadenosine phosphosulfate reductase family protein [Alphaproteobacteria bacterium]